MTPTTAAVIDVSGAVRCNLPWVDSTSGPPARMKMKDGKNVNQVTTVAASAVVTNDLDGHGNFNTTISGESFVGDATRKAGSSRDGLANGAGNPGSYINCQYTMNSATLGTGSCALSNGARFTMHVGQ